MKSRRGFMHELSGGVTATPAASSITCAGIPPAVALCASAHASDESKRHVNMTPDQLLYLLEPLAGQSMEEVQTYAQEVMHGLRNMLKYDQVEKLFALPPAWVECGNIVNHLRGREPILQQP